MIKDEMEKIYRDVSPDRIPWNNPVPPGILREAVQANVPERGRIVDLGCGAGNHVIWFAKMGYRVTGIDISESALGIARGAASKAGVDCGWIAADVTRDLPRFRAKFDFAYDWEMLHHIFPEDREGYVGSVPSLLKPRCKYLSVCFSEDSPQFGGAGKYRKTPIGTTLYFSSERELSTLFGKHFEIEELRTIEVQGRNAVHRAIYALMRNRDPNR